MRRFAGLVVVCAVIGCNDVVPLVVNDSKRTTPEVADAKEGEFRLTQKEVGGHSLVPVKLLDDHLEILLPADFGLMTEEASRMKYPKKVSSDLIFTDRSGSVDVFFQQGEKVFSPADFQQMYEDFGPDMRQAVPPGAQWIDSGKEQYRGREWIQLEYKMDAVGITVHRLSAMSSAGGHMLTISFNVPESLSDEWLEVGREVIKSAIYTD